MLQHLPYQAKLTPGQFPLQDVLTAKLDTRRTEILVVVTHEVRHNIHARVVQTILDQPRSDAEISAPQVNQLADPMLVDEFTNQPNIGRNRVFANRSVSGTERTLRYRSPRVR